MSVVRVVHNTENPFVQLNKVSLWDKNLSLKAVGLWARCMSKPTDWRFTAAYLIKACKEGKESIYSTLKELIEAGYVLRLDASIKNENGRFTKNVTEYIIFERPITEEEKTFYIEEFKKSFRHPGFPHAENPPLLIKNKTNNSKNKITSGTDKPKPEAPKKAKKEEIASGEEAERGLKSDKLKDPPNPMRQDFEKLPKSLQESVMRLALECKPFIASKLLGTVRDGKKIYNHEKFEDKVIRQTLESQLSKKRKKETQNKKKFKG